MPFDELKAIIVDQLDTAPEDVSLASSFTDDLGADSLDMVELIMAIEEKMGVRIEQKEARNLTTVGDVLAFVEAQKASEIAR
jgi:acyl carrier protein